MSLIIDITNPSDGIVYNYHSLMVITHKPVDLNINIAIFSWFNADTRILGKAPAHLFDINIPNGHAMHTLFNETTLKNEQETYISKAYGIVHTLNGEYGEGHILHQTILQGIDFTQAVAG